MPSPTRYVRGTRAAGTSAALTLWGRWPPGPIGWVVVAGIASVRPARGPPQRRW
ncbi:hypothetical protein MKSMC1_56750 [Mycobacterium kansasii]|nr:hypothetical protein MKSMC1_56750 [Mycobacterium kansasii]